MAGIWLYSDWRSQGSASAQASRLALHLQEIEDRITADVASHSYSRQNHPLLDLFKTLTAEYKELVSLSGVGGGTAYGRFRRPM